MGFTNSLYRWLGVTTPFDPQCRFVTSYLVPPIALCAWRAVVSLYTFVTLVLSYVFDGAKEFSYFTILSYWGVWAYHTISAVHTFSYCVQYRKWERRFQNTNDTPDNILSDQQKPRSWLSSTFPRPLQFLHYLLFSTINTYPLIVTIIFWSILAEGAYTSQESSWSNLSVHALNLVFSMVDVVFLGREPMMPWSHCLLVVVMLAAYVGVAYITYADQRFYVYAFLDQGRYGEGTVSGFIIAIGVGCVISFMIGQFLIFVREWVASQIQGSGQWGSAKAIGVCDNSVLHTIQGPGPEGEGGRKHDVGEQENSQAWRQRWVSIPHQNTA